MQNVREVSKGTGITMPAALSEHGWQQKEEQTVRTDL
jgi:hypothetical protein